MAVLERLFWPLLEDGRRAMSQRMWAAPRSCKRELKGNNIIVPIIRALQGSSSWGACSWWRTRLEWWNQGWGLMGWLLMTERSWSGYDWTRTSCTCYQNCCSRITRLWGGCEWCSAVRKLSLCSYPSRCGRDSVWSVGSGLPCDLHFLTWEKSLRVSKARPFLREGAVWDVSPWQAPDRPWSSSSSLCCLCQCLVLGMDLTL